MPRTRRTRFGALCISVIALLTSGCFGNDDTNTTEAMADLQQVVEGPETMSYTTEELLIPGPARAMSVSSDGTPNRVGSLDVPVRSYIPDEEAWATLVWAHGGSFVHGTLDWPESDWVAARFAESGIRVYAVDYVLASDRVKAPAPANDVLAVARWASESTGGPLALGGGSAGAHLASLAAVALGECRSTASAGETVAGSLADREVVDTVRAPDGLLLLYPTLHRQLDENPAISAITRSLPDQRRFGPGRVAAMYDMFLGDAAGTESVPAASADETCVHGYSTVPRVIGELDASHLRQLPPTIIMNADADDLRASGERFAEQLDAAGVPVTISLQPGTIHGYMNRPLESMQAEADARATIAYFVDALRSLVR